MTRVFAIVNQKGGVGKTTTTVNLATALAAVGKKVLIIDFDPQGNASTGFGIAERDLTSYDLILGDVTISEAAQKTAVPNLHIVPSTIDLSGAEIEMVSLVRREYRLKNAIDNSTIQYDYILIDCPPSLGLLTLNALTAASSVFIPLQCEFYAMEGLSHLMRTVELVKANLNTELDIQGIVLTMYDRRNKLTEHIENEVRSFFGKKVYKAVIPRNVRMSEAPSHGKPALIYDINCTGSRAYISLASELLKRERARKKENELNAA